MTSRSYNVGSGALPPGSHIVHYSKAEAMAAYDALPARFKHLVDVGPTEISTVELLKSIEQHGEERMYVGVINWYRSFGWTGPVEKLKRTPRVARY